MSAMRQLWSHPAFIEAVKKTAPPTTSANGAAVGDQLQAFASPEEPEVAQDGGGSAQASNPSDARKALDPTSTDLFFDWKSPALTARDKESLDSYANVYLMAKSPKPVVVDAYASKEGDPGYNLKLSQDRADSVANYLRKKGVPVAKAKGHGATDDFSKDELRPNRRATITPPPLEHLITGVDKPPDNKKPNLPLGEEAPKIDISTLPIPEPAEPGKKRPAKEDDDPEVSVEVNPNKRTVQTQVEYTVVIRAKAKDGTIQVLPDLKLTAHVSDPGQRGLVDEAQLEVIKLHVEKNVKLVGHFELEATVSFKTETNLTDDAFKKVKSGIEAEVELKVGKLSLTVSSDPEGLFKFKWVIRGGDDKKEEREKLNKATKQSGDAGKEGLDRELKRIKQEYVDARDEILSKLPENVREMARNEMDEPVKKMDAQVKKSGDAVKRVDAFFASQGLKAAGVSSDVENEMKQVVEDYRQEVLQAIGAEN